MNLSEKTLVRRLDTLTPGAKSAKLGQVIEDLITNYNALQASYAALATKYGTLLAHLDTANVAGIGAANAATYGVTATSSAQIKVLSAR
jgi:hypothetical protein